MTTEYVTMMEPMLPPVDGALTNKVVDLITCHSRLQGVLHPYVEEAVASLLRQMNCYYSNLIEGHYTHPIDIERAMEEDFSAEPEKRDLQKEAHAHVTVQAYIDEHIDSLEPYQEQTVRRIHELFYENLPTDLRWVIDTQTSEKIEVIPGQYRHHDVRVGRHVGIQHDNITTFMERFSQAYTSPHLDKIKQVVAVAAAHHRLVWIHPFADGNGRVGRLLSHLALQKAGVGSPLWSVARGFARDQNLYKQKLALADTPRQGDLDGRGSLSEKALTDFCHYFLDTAIDQVDFMAGLLEMKSLSQRISDEAKKRIAEKKLAKGSDILLREILLFGEVQRKEVANMLGIAPRTASQLMAKLMKQKLLTSATPYGPLRLNFTAETMDVFFPRLFVGAI